MDSERRKSRATEMRTVQYIWLWFFFFFFFFFSCPTIPLELKTHGGCEFYVCVCVCLRTCKENDNRMGQCGHSHAV